MIKPNEVRRGNLVEYDGRVFEIDVIAEEFPTLNTTEFGIDVVDWNNIRPIPLSEEWLLKCGFENKKDGKFYHSKFDRTWVRLDSILVKWYGNALGGIMMLDYVHQLQNIFFSLTSEELIMLE